ncbi:MAG: hypothetical protein WBG30_02710 [Psychrilyobacter sp.]|uniref:hypothetical protein n=1 Tax=Psychrilyobacter sp. TaxID=2586924 RepID=UPI003C7420EB
MKKIFLIFALTTLMSIGANAEENDSNAQVQEEVATSTSSSTPAPQSNLSDSFMAAFGMDVSAGGSGEAAPGMEGASSAGTMAVGMSTISTTSANQVTPPFTPYSYQK